MDYQRGVVTGESVWRAIVLYGANSATYKFAFGATLLDIAATGRNHVTLEELAPRYAELLCQALQRQPRQGTSESSRFLAACRAFNAGEIDLDTLHRRTVQLGFANVIDAFPKLGGDQAPVRYYEDRRKSPVSPGLVLRDELLELARSVHAPDLDAETAARWRLVETAWATGVSGAVLVPSAAYDSSVQLVRDPGTQPARDSGVRLVRDSAPRLVYDSGTQHLVLRTELRRKSVTGVVPALNGYQDGRCAYCDQLMVQESSGPIVEHVLPWKLLTRDWNGPDVDTVWNLVLSCKPCNNAKRDRAPHESWMPWLEQRNNDLIESRHPLRDVLIAQTGATPARRRVFLKDAYRRATELLPAVWTPG
ncbi:HNH endonuclease signature motif containing protein [Streptosporangium sp. NPDC048047]|uniref:HNH endonuclease n=1 Tax=Streptosporangium sp. NPDC048047 TaxID=3155748 RepID=UPI00342F7B0F